MSVSHIYDLMARSDTARQCQTAYWQATGLTLFLVPPDGYWQLPPSCAFCTHAASLSAGAALCKQNFERMRAMALRQKPAWHCCFAGLMAAVVPIIDGTLHIGTILGGRVLVARPTAQAVARIARQLDLTGSNNRALIARTLAEVPVLSASQREGHISLLTMMAERLARKASGLLLTESITPCSAINTARIYMETHFAEDLDFRAVSRLVGMSPWHFSHRFKQSTGMSFTQFLARLRIRAAQVRLKNPHLRVGEIAFECGFGTIQTFNRVFRQYTGVAPTSFRKGCS